MFEREEIEVSDTVEFVKTHINDDKFTNKMLYIPKNIVKPFFASNNEKIWLSGRANAIIGESNCHYFERKIVLKIVRFDKDIAYMDQMQLLLELYDLDEGWIIEKKNDIEIYPVIKDNSRIQELKQLIEVQCKLRKNNEITVSQVISNIHYPNGDYADEGAMLEVTKEEPL